MSTPTTSLNDPVRVTYHVEWFDPAFGDWRTFCNVRIVDEGLAARVLEHVVARERDIESRFADAKFRLVRQRSIVTVEVLAP